MKKPPSPLVQQISLLWFKFVRKCSSPKQWKSVKAYRNGLGLLKQDSPEQLAMPILWGTASTNQESITQALGIQSVGLSSATARRLGLLPSSRSTTPGSSPASGQTATLKSGTGTTKAASTVFRARRLEGSDETQSRTSHRPSTVSVGDDLRGRCTQCLRLNES